MPGPNSMPRARSASGALQTGKSALKRHGLTSREGLSKEDHLFGQRKAEEQRQQREDAKQLENVQAAAHKVLDNK